MALAHINIGSNIGDRRATIARAVAAIQEHFGAETICSHHVESAPWGYDSTNTYINIGLNIEVGDTPPDEVLRALLDIQNRIDATPHRTADGTYADRQIDIDLIAIGSLVYESPLLTLPHPRMHLREFVLAPMMEILPDWIHPLLHSTPAQLLRDLTKPAK